jgi:hypothetical protein
MVASVALVVNDPERERSKGRKRESEQRPALMQSAVCKSVRSRCGRDLPEPRPISRFRPFAFSPRPRPRPAEFYSVGGLILHQGDHAPATSSPPPGGRWRGGMWGWSALVQNRSSHRPEVGGEAADGGGRR